MAGVPPLLVPGNLTGDWKMAQDLVQDLQRGDCIEIYRKPVPFVAYSHWAVFIGMDRGLPTVVHFSNNHETDFELADEVKAKVGFAKSAVTIRINSLFDIALDSPCRVNNYLDERNTPLPPDEIIKKALEEVEKSSGGYNFLYNNCEHFVTSLRYGKRKSNQVFNTCIVGASLTAVATLSIINPMSVLFACGMILYSKHNNSRQN